MSACLANDEKIANYMIIELIPIIAEHKFMLDY